MTRVTDQREQMANQLLMRGHATMKEILTASLGEWPPKGLLLNPDITHEQKIVFKPLIEGLPPNLNIFSRVLECVFDQLFIKGRCAMDGEREIFINTLKLKTLPRLFGLTTKVRPTMIHEGAHGLQGDHFYRVRELFGHQAADSLKMQTGAGAEVIMEPLLRREAKTQEMFRDRGYIAGTASGIELQARLHEVISDGYRRWGRVPLDKDELWAALANSGITPPADIVACLQALPLRAEARLFLSCPVEVSSAADNIQSVDGHLSKEGRNIFWQESLPKLYADLIEMWGDVPGRERFGFGPNPRAEYKQLASPPPLRNRKSIIPRVP